MKNVLQHIPTLDALVRVEDALSAITQHQNKADFVNAHSPRFRPAALLAYHQAELLIGEFGTAQKAQKAIRERMDSLVTPEPEEVLE